MSENTKKGSKRLQLAFAVAVLIGAILLLVVTEWGSKTPNEPHPPPNAPTTGSISTPPSTSAALPSQGSAEESRAPAVIVHPGPTPVRAFYADPSTPPPPEERSALADALNTPGSDGARDLAIVASLFTQFQDHFRELPIGNNAEITAALAGDNARGLALIPADHPAINAGGELVDRWGTPLFFHQLGADVMEIRMAGADRRQFTADDLVFPNPEATVASSDSP